jgi:RNA polymerase sigma-70 factor (ECF subfamily)
VEPHIPGLRRFALALMRGNRECADDLVQDALVAALARWHQLRDERHLKAWLYTILFNRFVTVQQRRRRLFERTVSFECCEAELPGVEGGQEGALARRDLLRAFAGLPGEQRAVMVLAGVEGFSYAEAAEVLGVPVGTVMSRLSRGRERLRLAMSAAVRAEQRQGAPDVRRPPAVSAGPPTDRPRRENRRALALLLGE